MLISTKGRYALRVMADMVQNQGDGYMPLREVAERQGISPKYLEAIVSTLQKSGILVGVRGKGGGYKLAHEPGEVTVGDILRVTEGTLAPVACLECEVNDCERAGECPTLPLWEQLKGMIDDYLDGITLEDLASGNLE